MDLKKGLADNWFRGQLVLLVLVALWAPLAPRHINLGRFDAPLNRVDPGWIRWIGVALTAAAIGLIGSAVRAMGKSLTPGTEPLPEGELITTGPFSSVRHPIYRGIIFLLSGYTMAWSNWTLATLVFLISRLYFEGKAKAEETWLRARFPEYARYEVRVRRRVL